MSANFADKSRKGQTVTNNGVDISQQNELGFGSYYFDGSSNISIAANDDFNLDGDNFTIDFWLNFSSVSSDMYFMFNRQGSNAGFMIYRDQTNNRLYFANYDGVSAYDISFYTSWTPSVDTWYHLAFVRDASTWYIFIDGISQSLTLTNGSYSAFLTSSNSNLYIGSTDTGTYFNGYMDQPRITKYKTIWTANFLPPTRTMDAIDTDTTLLIHGDAVADVSPSKHSITAQGSTATSSDQTKFFDTSIKFDGNDDFLLLSDDPGFSFGNDDFTIDFWVYFNDLSSTIAAFLAQGRVSEGSTSSYYFRYFSNNLQFLYTTDGDYASLAGPNFSWTPSTGQWYHVAVVRSGNDALAFVNGKQIGSTGSFSGDTIYDSSDDILIGAAYSTGTTAIHELNGYIDEYRITKGVARWTADFSPPIAQYPKPYKKLDLQQDVDNETKLLIHGNRITTDHSKSDHTITNNNVTLSSTQTKFQDTSLSFNGSTAYMTLSDSDDWRMGTGAFTIELWMYITSTSASTPIGFGGGVFGWNATNGIEWRFAFDSNTLYFQWFQGGTSHGTITNSISTNTWHHVAAVGDGSEIRLYIDGVLVDTETVSATITAITTPTGVKIGVNEAASGGYFNGYIDEIRVTKGVARYVNNFDVATINYPEAQDNSTKLLLHMQKLDGNTYFQDDSASNHVALANVNATLSTTKKYFGSHSLYLDGSNSRLTIPHSTDFATTTEFTVECWINFSTISPDRQMLFSKGGWGTSSDTAGYCFFYESGAGLRYYVTTGSSTLINTVRSWTPNVGQWYHVALVRWLDGSNNKYGMYVDGSLLDSAWHTNANDTTSTQDLLIGTGYDDNNDLNGYIDEFRFTRGVSRWHDTSFTVPTAPYPNYM